MSYFTKIAYDDSGSLDAFSRLRVSSTESLFTVQSQYDANPMEMEGGATGTGITPLWNGNNRMVAISTTPGTGVSYYQSYQYSPYEPGRSQFIAITGVFGAGIAGASVDYGYGDSANGIFLRQNGTSMQAVQRSSTSGGVAEIVVSQSNWNLDKMDGTGPSGITFDVTKAFILIIDLQFLGMGRVRLGLDIDGVIYYIHQFLNANVLTLPYMQSATLPISVTLTATETISTKTCYFKCATVQSEGGSLSTFGYTFSTPEGTVSAANGSRTHILSIRPRTTFGGIINRALFVLEKLNIAVTGANPVLWELVIGASFTVAPTYSNVNSTHSAFEYGTGGTFGNLTTGSVLQSGYVSASGSSAGASNIVTSLHNPIALNRAGAQIPGGTISLLVSGISGASATRATFNYSEIR